MGGNHGRVLVFIMFCFFTTTCQSWNWFSSSSPPPSTSSSYGSNAVRGTVAEYSADGFNDRKGMMLLENAKEKMLSSNPCWHNAYKNLFETCSNVLADEEKRSRLAWHLSDCFQEDSARPRFPHCDSKSSMKNCLRDLDEDAHKVYLEFYLDTNSLCHQLQAEAFKHETERLITDLKNSAHYVEDKLDTIFDKSENILQDNNKLHETLDSVNVRSQQVDEKFVTMVNRTEELMRNSESIYAETKKIGESQREFKEVQEEMKMGIKEGIEVVRESYNKLGEEIGKIRDESVEIQKEIMRVGETVSQEMQIVHTKTEDIAHLAAISVHNQQHLIDGQAKAIHDLDSLSQFQSKAFQESRMTLQQLTEMGHKQHQDVLLRQEQLQGLHDRLMTNSKSILSAQESFESKQASMFTFLEKIFSLQNAMFLESRMIKAFIIYFVSILVIYMLTSTKQTYNIRPWLYIGLCVVFFMEISIVRFTAQSFEQQALIITLIRSLFLIIASLQLLYAIFTYRDYEVLNYHLIQNLVDKISIMEQREKLAWVMNDDEEEEDLDWSEFIERDLPEEVGLIEDPDFEIAGEEVGENAITVSSKRYNLRNRRSYYR